VPFFCLSSTTWAATDCSKATYTLARVMQSLVLNAYLTTVGLFSVVCGAKSVYLNESAQNRADSDSPVSSKTDFFETVLSDHEESRLEHWNLKVEKQTGQAAGNSRSDRESQ